MAVILSKIQEEHRKTIQTEAHRACRFAVRVREAGSEQVIAHRAIEGPPTRRNTLFDGGIWRMSSQALTSQA